MRYLALLGWFVSAALLTTIVRLAVLSFARRVPGYLPERVAAVIVGGGDQAAALLRHLRTGPDPRYRVVGFFDDLPNPAPGLQDVPFLGDTSALARTLAAHRVAEVFVALPWSAGARITAVLEQLRFLPVTVRLLPEQLPPALASGGRDLLAGVTLPTLMAPPFTAFDRVAKRAFDLVAASVLLLLSLPVFGVVAALVKLDSAGPALFLQPRTGQFGRSFRIVKFRTLLGAQDVMAETLVGVDDRRVTRVGRVLRRHSLDELPQLINVIRGDMSLVGPRPHAARARADGRAYADAMPDYLLRYRAKPGMTGWAQVNGWRGRTDTLEKLQRRVEYDFQYIQTWSMALDLYILLRTVPVVFASGAGRG